MYTIMKCSVYNFFFFYKNFPALIYIWVATHLIIHCKCGASYKEGKHVYVAANTQASRSLSNYILVWVCAHKARSLDFNSQGAPSCTPNLPALQCCLKCTCKVRRVMNWDGLVHIHMPNYFMTGEHGLAWEAWCHVRWIAFLWGFCKRARMHE